MAHQAFGWPVAWHLQAWTSERCGSGNSRFDGLGGPIRCSSVRRRAQLPDTLGACAVVHLLLALPFAEPEGDSLSSRSLPRRWAAAISVFGTLLAAERPAMAADLSRIETIVVLYAENRSFDHLYGLFPGANGIANASREQAAQR